MTDSRYRLDIDQVRNYLPHRHPFLLVDRVLEIHPVGDLNDLSSGSHKVGIKVVAIKNISYNEPCFQGHFPGFALYPGVLILESMAQTASFSLYPYLEKDVEKLRRDFKCILVGIDSVRFRRPVLPGDTLRLESVVKKCRGRLWIFETTATVDGEPVAEAQIMANLILKDEVV